MKMNNSNFINNKKKKYKIYFAAKLLKEQKRQISPFNTDIY